MVLRPQRGLFDFLLASTRLSSEAVYEEQRDNCAHHRRVIAHYEHGTQNQEAGPGDKSHYDANIPPCDIPIPGVPFNVFIYDGDLGGRPSASFPRTFLP